MVKTKEEAKKTVRKVEKKEWKRLIKKAEKLGFNLKDNDHNDIIIFQRKAPDEISAGFWFADNEWRGSIYNRQNDNFYWFSPEESAWLTDMLMYLNTFEVELW